MLRNKLGVPLKCFVQGNDTNETTSTLAPGLSNSLNESVSYLLIFVCERECVGVTSPVQTLVCFVGEACLWMVKVYIQSRQD